MRNEYPLFLGNNPISDSEKFKIECPFDNSIIGLVNKANQNHIETAIDKAEKVFKITRMMPAYKRAQTLNNIAKDIQERSDELSKILALECGKNINFARGEVQRAFQTFTIASEECKRIEGEFFSLDSTKKGEGKSALVKRFPIGPILGITPFNFPLNLVAHKVAPALAVGNPITIKPSSLAPISALLLAEIVTKYVPDGMLSVLPCSGLEIEQAVKDPRIKMISFTGSPPVGWRLKEICSKKKICLELGGNAGLILDKDCDIEDAISKTIIGGFAYAGQVCIHTQRIYVHEKIYVSFVSKFIEKIKELKSGHPLDENVFLNSMITETEAIRAKKWVNEAVDSGAKILCGGERKGNNFSATVLTDTTPDMKVEAKEIFAPVVAINSFKDFKDAVEMVNNTIYGLQAGVFSNNMKNIFYAFENLEVGGVIINDVPTFRVDQMPYGGIKNSGFGREGVKYAMEEMTEMKLMVIG
ncbi:MAG: aldehyde dehydrogenase family protein [Candidatus Cloacimonadota bacterium]|nr:aldehyde dehydrogenase family protein [Candidatus Cloacimonadota bacterium]